MDSFMTRLQSLIFQAAIVLLVTCCLVGCTDFFNSPSPTAHLEVLKVNKFQEHRTGDAEVRLTLNITADLQSLFTWNTKQVFVFLAAEYKTADNALNQVSLWDAIIPLKEQAKFSFRTTNKYRFIDQGNNLRGKEFNLTLNWQVMPMTNKLFDGKIVKSGYRLPESYR